MSAVLTIALLTGREAVRRKLVAAFAFISVALVVLSGWGFYRLSHGSQFTSGETNLALPQAVVLFMFMFSFMVALSASAVASLAVSGEIDSGVLQTVVARPIRRSDVLLGKWLGLVGLLAAYTAIVCGLLVGVVYWASGFIAPDPVASAAFVCGEGIVLLTFVLLLSTRLSALAAGVIGVAVFGMAWLAGVAGSLSVAFHIRGLHAVSEVSQYLLPTDGLWHGAMYYLEPPSFVTQQLAGTPVGTGDPFLSITAPPWPYLVWAAIWLVLVLVLGLVSFERREL
jgi:ABC-type transport system involved in multi-copper enzyme maturation permease subunit